MTITRRHRNERIAAAIFIVVVLIAVVIFVHWNKSEEEVLQGDASYIPKKETITPQILLLRDYVRIDTSTAEGAAKGARWLAAQLERNGVHAQLIESTPGRWNVYARIRGKRRGGGLLLVNHIDVVGVKPAEWQHPPFAGEIDLNQLWGRGALDMKGIALCELFAMAAVQRNGAPEHDIVFLATAEEEEGSENGMKWLLAHRPDLFEDIEYAISEGGITEVISEKMTYFGIEVGSKQRVHLMLRAPQKQMLLDARMALEPYMTSRERARVLPEVRQFFRDVAATRMAFKDSLSDIDRAIAAGKVWSLPAAYRDLLQNTMNVEMPLPEGDHWYMSVLMLNLPDELPKARAEWMQQFVARYGGITVSIDSEEGPVPSSRTDTPLMRMLAREARAYYRVNAGSEILYSSTSDCRFLRVRGMQCYGVSPYLADISQSLTIHRADERIRLDWFMDGIDYFERAMLSWSQQR
jgi:acetylornithine deacetylase/succinyl-diaminopimelate desuccinylase-like protein